MSSVVSFGTNTNAQRKRVKWYNRESSAEILYEGQPVCYMFDTTNNILGIDTGSANAASTTTTEGGQNEGKFMIVEKAETDNLLHFAGVVAHGSWCGTSVAATSYKWIEIFIPNGAVVPVRCDIAVTSGRTILSLENDSQALTQTYSASYTSRPVAIAVETDSTLTTAGLTLAKVDPNIFICQDLSTSSALIIATTGSASCALNRINVTTAATSGEMCAFEVKMASTGGVNSPYGLAGYFRSTVSATVSDSAYSLGVIMTTNAGTHEGAFGALRVKTHSGASAVMTSLSYLDVVYLEASFATAGPSYFSWIHLDSQGAVHPSYLFYISNAGDTSDATVTTADITSQDGATDRNIPILIGGAVYYLRAFVTA